MPKKTPIDEDDFNRLWKEIDSAADQLDELNMEFDRLQRVFDERFCNWEKGGFKPENNNRMWEFFDKNGKIAATELISRFQNLTTQLKSESTQCQTFDCIFREQFMKTFKSMDAWIEPEDIGIEILQHWIDVSDGDAIQCVVSFFVDEEEIKLRASEKSTPRENKLRNEMITRAAAAAKIKPEDFTWKSVLDELKNVIDTVREKQALEREKQAIAKRELEKNKPREPRRCHCHCHRMGTDEDVFVESDIHPSRFRGEMPQSRYPVQEPTPYHARLGEMRMLSPSSDILVTDEN